MFNCKNKEISKESVDRIREDVEIGINDDI